MMEETNRLSDLTVESGSTVVVLLNPSLKPPSITYSKFFPRNIIRMANDQLSQFDSSLGDESRRMVLYTSSDEGLMSVSDISRKKVGCGVER